MTATLLFLWAVLVQAAIGEQPEESELPPQIIGGHETIPHQYPFQVSLRDKSTNKFLCGGSLINKQWVLTAAHCVASRYDVTPANKIAVKLGSHFRNKTISGETTAFVSEHFYYNRDKEHNVWKHDIALIKLTEPVNLTVGVIWPVKLPDEDEELSNPEVVTLVGWGVSEVKYFQSGYAVQFCGNFVTPAPSSQYKEKEMPNCGGTVKYSNTAALFTPYALQHTTIPTVSRDDCYRHIAKSRDLQEINLDVDLVICVGTQKSSSCTGDSGGPMVKMVNGEWVQFGVTSFGENLCRLDLGPSVYTKVSRYIGWINDIINSNTDMFAVPHKRMI